MSSNGPSREGTRPILAQAALEKQVHLWKCSLLSVVDWNGDFCPAGGCCVQAGLQNQIGHIILRFTNAILAQAFCEKYVLSIRLIFAILSHLWVKVFCRRWRWLRANTNLAWLLWMKNARGTKRWFQQWQPATKIAVIESLLTLHSSRDSDVCSPGVTCQHHLKRANSDWRNNTSKQDNIDPTSTLSRYSKKRE